MSLRDNVTVLVVKPLYPPRPVQFTLLLVAMLVSIPCFIFVLYHFLVSRTLRSALNNHVVILLLISNGIQTFTDVPMHLSLLLHGCGLAVERLLLLRAVLSRLLFVHDVFSVPNVGLDRATHSGFSDAVLQYSSATSARSLSTSRGMLDVSAGVLCGVFLLVSLRELLR